ncbi:hypothetical protein MACJ_002451 [Theileria orientalis]|uniref:Uncharacterized protein n=1 Tax=Theileria orientalis TaxID=68886 RepID=A0A976M667_THEOR|nr:hypothetical protein MACJ_002451 [Theileria orientalis]
MNCYRFNTLIWIFINVTFLYQKNLAESINSAFPSGQKVFTVGSQYGTKKLNSLDNAPNRNGPSSGTTPEDASNFNTDPEPVYFETDNEDDSEEHELEFTEGARCLEVRCHGELVWKSESEDQGKLLKLRRKDDTVEIEDQGTGEVKRLELGNELYLDLFTLGSKHPNDRSKYDFKKISNEEGIFIFKKGVKCNEVRGNGLPVWKAAKGDRVARSVSYYGTREISITFSDGVNAYNRKDGKWVKKEEEEEKAQPEIPEVPQPEIPEEEPESIPSDEPDSEEPNIPETTSEEQEIVVEDSHQEEEQQEESLPKPALPAIQIEDSRQQSSVKSEVNTQPPPPPSPKATMKEPPKQASQVTSVLSYSQTQKRKEDEMRSELNAKSKDELLELVMQLNKMNEFLDKDNKRLSLHVQRLTKPSPTNIYPVVLNTIEGISTDYFEYSRGKDKHTYTAKAGFLFKLVKHYKDILWHTLNTKEFSNKVEIVEEKKAVIYHVNGTKTEKDLNLYYLELFMDIKNSTDEVIYKKNEKKNIEVFIPKPTFLIENAWHCKKLAWKAQPDPKKPEQGPVYSRKIVINNNENPPSFRVYFYGGSDKGADDDERDPDYVVVPKPYSSTAQVFKLGDSSSGSQDTQESSSSLLKTDVEKAIQPPSASTPPPHTSQHLPELKLFTSDPNDETKTLELDSNSYELKELGSGRKDYELKSDVKCKLVVCEGIDVWKHGDFECQDYPLIVSYTNGILIVIHFSKGFITYEKGTVVKWIGDADDLDTSEVANSDESIR